MNEIMKSDLEWVLEELEASDVSFESNFKEFDVFMRDNDCVLRSGDGRREWLLFLRSGFESEFDSWFDPSDERWGWMSALLKYCFSQPVKSVSEDDVLSMFKVSLGGLSVDELWVLHCCGALDDSLHDKVVAWIAYKNFKSGVSGSIKLNLLELVGSKQEYSEYYSRVVLEPQSSAVNSLVNNMSKIREYTTLADYERHYRKSIEEWTLRELEYINTSKLIPLERGKLKQLRKMRQLNNKKNVEGE